MGHQSVTLCVLAGYATGLMPALNTQLILPTQLQTQLHPPHLPPEPLLDSAPLHYHLNLNLNCRNLMYAPTVLLMVADSRRGGVKSTTRLRPLPCYCPQAWKLLLCKMVLPGS